MITASRERKDPHRDVLRSKEGINMHKATKKTALQKTMGFDAAPTWLGR
jgi:hypothetical protein